MQARERERTLVSSQIYRLADAMSQRDIVTQTREQCIDLIISVALDGEVVGGRVARRNDLERKEAYDRLENGEGAPCSHCGVSVVWKAGKDNQVS